MTDHIARQLLDLQKLTAPGEVLKINGVTVTLSRWGKIIAMGVRGVAAALNNDREQQQQPYPIKR